MEELMHEPWLQIPEDNAVNAYVAAALRARGLALPTPTVSTYSMHVRYNLLSTGRFLALLWNWTLHFNSNGDSVKALPVELGIPARPVATVRLKNRTLSPIAERFIEQARGVANSMTIRRRAGADLKLIRR